MFEIAILCDAEATHGPNDVFSSSTETEELALSGKSSFRSSSAVQVGLLLLCSLEQELYQGPNVDEEGVLRANGTSRL